MRGIYAEQVNKAMKGSAGMWVILLDCFLVPSKSSKIKTLNAIMCVPVDILVVLFA